MIELRHIGKTYNRSTSDPVRALQDITLSISDSEFIVVVGPNGSGKTTLLNALAGTIQPDDGEILIDNADITRVKEFQRSRWIARIFQNPLMGTAPELTVLENFRLASLRTQSKGFQIGTGVKFESLVKEKISILNLGLENKISQPMGTLSGGQRQALTLLMAVMDETKILLMDEPTAALDPRTSQLILQLADKIIAKFKLTVLFVTHQLKDALGYGNRLMLMSDGKIIRNINKEEKQLLSIQDAYSWFE